MSDALLFHVVVGNLTVIPHVTVCMEAVELLNKKRNSVEWWKRYSQSQEQFKIVRPSSKPIWINSRDTKNRSKEIIIRQIKPSEIAKLKEATIGMKLALKSAASEVELNHLSRHLVTIEERENIQKGIVPFKSFDDKSSHCRFCSPLPLDGIEPVSWPSKLLFLSDNSLSFPTLENREICPLRWLLPRSKNSMLVRFHRGLVIDPDRLQSLMSNTSNEVRWLNDSGILPIIFTPSRNNFMSDVLLFHLAVGNLKVSWGLDDNSRDSKSERWKTLSGNIPHNCVSESILPVIFSPWRYNSMSDALLFHLVVGNLTVSWGLYDKLRDSKLERWRTLLGDITCNCVFESCRIVK
ncbi:hypothetical protein H5410_000176 [Solanum commersonii]|uniref:Uncharacterized protein n=1 Tax=Solanum commersonii TaxID=4109 RepID=A0A9J6AW36_SOLCO|nr:hypothetical protein H5410_000176 [Solanum commersonii]